MKQVWERLRQDPLSAVLASTGLLLPVVFSFWTQDRFELPKIVLFYASTLGLGIAWLWVAVGQKRLRLRHSPLLYLAMGFLLWSGLSAWLGLDLLTSLVGVYYRFSGSVLHIFSFTLALLVLISQREKLRWDWLINGLLVGVLLASAYGIAQWFGWDLRDFAQGYSRATSSFGEPTNLAGFLVSCLPLAWYRLLRRRQARVSSLLAWGAAILGFWALLLTYSRSGWLALLVALLFGAAVLVWRRIGFSSSVWKKLGLLAVLYLLLAGYVLSQPVRNEYAFTDREVNTLTLRLDVWRVVPTLVAESPWWGSGPETFEYSFAPHRPASFNQLPEYDKRFDRAHNEFLHQFATVGIVGGLLFLSLFIYPLWLGWKRSRKREDTAQTIAWMMVLVGLAVHVFFSFLNVSLWWVWLLALVALSPQGRTWQLATPSLLKPSTWSKASLTTMVLLALGGMLLSLSAAIGWQVYADLVYRKAVVTYEADQYAEAAPLFAQAVGRNLVFARYPRYAARNALAQWKQDAQPAQADQALAYARQAFDLNPADPDSEATLVLILLELSDAYPALLSEANERAEILIDQEPTNVTYREMLAISYLKRGLAEEGIAQLRQAIELKPDFSSAHVNLIQAYLTHQDRASALAAARQLAEFEPNHPLVRELLEPAID